ncbi:class I SAM-dependent methyltransferase [Salibaculum sp.]|uniref:class I SAM-dependent methyltransferase n=1 Tax=Salibaculum sp. TaxID=2855480 RepID=UPI002B49BDFF|nr:class I SAM-dependent methyltransferase [Salibaculum sp.]HKL70335.1 class I SAM-dependent methyltransferase [Salibaculum sp.]
MSDETTIETWDRIADEFLRRRTRTLIEKRWLDRMVGVAPADDGPRRLLDLGCGTGLPLATYLSDRGLRVTGVDAAPRMLAHFRANLPRAEAHQVDMRDLALGRPFDALLAWDSLLHLTPEEQRKMVPVFRRHAATGAALMFTTSAQPGETWKEAVAGAPVYHAALDPAEYRALLDENRFRLVDVRAEDPDCTDHSVWLARFTGE